MWKKIEMWKNDKNFLFVLDFTSLVVSIVVSIVVPIGLVLFVPLLFFAKMYSLSTTIYSIGFMEMMGNADWIKVTSLYLFVLSFSMSFVLFKMLLEGEDKQRGSFMLCYFLVIILYIMSYVGFFYYDAPAVIYITG